MRSGSLFNWFRQGSSTTLERKLSTSDPPLRGPRLTGRLQETPLPLENNRSFSGPLLLDRRLNLTDAPYVIPNNPEEHIRLNYQHYVFLHALGNHILAPIKDTTNSILDVGCGPGRWVEDVARRLPRAHVIGLDICLPRPLLPVPTNAIFEQGNILMGLPFADGSFDYTHQRLMAGSIPFAYWPAELAELVRVTRPGGWVELVEGGDIYYQAGPALRQILMWERQVNMAKGVSHAVVWQMDKMLRSAGLQKVTEWRVRAPVGSWGGRIGKLLGQNLYAAFHNLKEFYASVLGLSVRQLTFIIEQLPKEWELYRTEFTFCVAFGQRPEINKQSLENADHKSQVA